MGFLIIKEIKCRVLSSYSFFFLIRGKNSGTLSKLPPAFGVRDITS